LLETIKEDTKHYKVNQEALVSNLRLQLDETKDMIIKVKDTKEREFRKLREKCDEEIRRETDKRQFEYDKLREEIQMFQRKL
jgi:low affinity Fe/Cu permease